MLFTYRYVTHRIEKFQGYLDHLVKTVWCKANGDFSVELLDPGLREIVLDIYNTEEDTTRGKVNDWLYGPIVEIYRLFNSLTPVQRQRISEWYDCNNDIEALCACDPAKLPVTYAGIGEIDPGLEKPLKDFCQSLFTYVIHLKAITSRMGEIDAHYDAFVTENNEDACPYCGYGSIKNPHFSTREAYDHFLPKATYPFNSVNFHNLAPMCHECNSSYKLGKDPIRKADGTRRKVFYSYGKVAPGTTVTLALKTEHIGNLRPEDVDLQLTAPGREEEVETWNDVFGVQERFTARICSKNGGKYWLARITDEAANVGLTREQLLTYEFNAADQSPYADANFLKKPFLIACRSAKII
jgi:hypothetical protein